MDRIDRLKELLRDTPNDSFLQHALALEYVKIGKDGEAQALFEAILAHDAGYIGSYYHLGKLLERTGDAQLAAQWYAKGMEMAAAAGDQRTLNELRTAWEEITGSFPSS